MARMGHVDFSELQNFRDEIEEKLGEQAIQDFIESCAKELAARLISKVIKRTPVGDYSGDAYTCASGEHHKGHKESGRVGGTLRRGWTVGEIRRTGDTYTIEIVNPVEYAPYVEFGHRTRNGGWSEGHFMLTISSQEIQNAAPGILEKKLKKKLAEVFKGGE